MRVPSFHHASWVSEYFTSPVADASPPQKGQANTALLATGGELSGVSISVVVLGLIGFGGACRRPSRRQNFVVLLESVKLIEH